MKRIVNPSILLTAMMFVLATSVHATGFSSFAANEKISLTGIQSGGQNELLFYRLEKDGSYTLISDTAGKYATETDFKVSKEENVEIYYRFRGSDYRKATYTGEMAKLKLDVGKVQLPHGLGNLTSGMFVYKGQWKTGKMEGTGDWEFIGSGEKYKGAFVNNLFQGEGDFTYNDGRLYIGSWANGKRNGKGEIYFPYQKVEFPICEFGAVKAVKLSVEWKNDTANGIGQLTYLVKSNKAGVPDEEVVLTNKREEPIYWKGFKATGTISAVVFTNGNQFKGEVKNGSVSDGELFYKVAGAEELGYKKGVWQNGLFTGKATLPITPKGFFKGYVKNDVRQGEGTMKFADGAIYSGNWENDNFSGQGKYQFTDGTYYEGMWKEGKQNGYGVRYNSFTKAYWKCNWKDNVPVDSGTVTSNSNNVITQYTGGVGGAKTDKGTKYFFEGFGRFKQIFPTEDTSMHKDSSYVGYFHEGLPHGKGEMKRRFGGDGETDMTEWTYTGEWVNGNKQGQGKQVTEFMIGFETYEGLWANGMKQGKGKLVSSGEGYESTYTGTWNDDKMVGYGEAISEFINPENGSVERSTYKGQFANDSRNGQGTEVSYEGTYTGNWKDGLRNGLGKMVYKDGRIYEGQWAGGPNGDGTLILANKSVQKGKFINGEFQKPFVARQAVIGSQVWMADNLTVTKFRNGDDIPEVTSKDEWYNYAEQGKPAFCYVNNDPANKGKYGVLYNYYAVADKRGLAPEGWRIPSHVDFQNLQAQLEVNIKNLEQKIQTKRAEGIDVYDLNNQLEKMKKECSIELAGSKLKARSGWANCQGADVYGFAARPTATRDDLGRFDLPNEYTEAAQYWTNSYMTNDNTMGVSYEIHWTGRFEQVSFTRKIEGLPIRCIK
jgi:uncharacterized protein (TIGR02145 family)